MPTAVESLQLLINLFMKQYPKERDAFIALETREQVTIEGREQPRTNHYEYYPTTILQNLQLEEVSPKNPKQYIFTIEITTSKLIHTQDYHKITLSLLQGVSKMTLYQYQSVYMWQRNIEHYFIIHFEVSEHYTADLFFNSAKMQKIMNTLRDKYYYHIPLKSQFPKETTFLINTTIEKKN